MKKRILIVTYYWPPSGGVGVQRWLFFANYLQQNGYDVTVFTPENPQFDIQDQSLIKKAENINTVKKKIWEPFQILHFLTGNRNKKHVKQGLVLEKSKKGIFDRLIVWIRANILVPDPRVFWVNTAVSEILRLNKKNKFDLLITTSPPLSIQLIGKKLKKKTEMTWIADFRDPWSEWDVLEKLQVSKPVMGIHKKMESSVLNQADRVLTISKTLANDFCKKVNEPNKIDVIYNGVSRENWDQKDDHSIIKDSNSFVIGYFGMLQDSRNPIRLWSTFNDICVQNENFSEKLELRFAGILSEIVISTITDHKKLKQAFKDIGYMSHETVNQEYKKCEILLLILNQTSNAKWILPMKFFEYLASGKPILALGPPESDLKHIMNGQKVGEYFQYDDEKGIYDFVMGVFEGKYIVNPNDRANLLNKYSKETSAEYLVSIINQHYAKN